MQKFTITEITEWIEDDHVMAGDASHEGRRAVQRLLEEERVRKLDEGKAEGLPYECEAEDIEDALDQYNEEHCRYDYLKAAECDYE